MRNLLLVSLLLSLTIASPSAEVYVVRPDGLGDFPNIQAAIDAAVDGDIIELTNGTFTGVGNSGIRFMGKAITVRSQSGDPPACRIDGGGSDGFRFMDEEGPGSVLEGIQVEDACIGIDCGSGSSPTINHCWVYACFCPEWTGWGMFVHEASPRLTDCQFVGNGSIESGGGAAVVSTDSSPEFLRCVFANNGNGYLEYSGGGIKLSGGSASFVDCLIGGNGSDQGWGAIRASDCDALTVTGCTFHRNTGESCGGLRVSNVGVTTISACTFCENEAAGVASDLWVAGASVVVENSILSFGQGERSVRCTDGGSITLTCCDFFGNSGEDWPECVADQLGIDGNIGLDPRFCIPGEDLTLQSCSPCAPFSPPNEDCDLIGAHPVGCDFTPVVPTTWGRLKRLFHD